ncbi:dynein light chain roadblock-type 1 [Manduca sexta]|uniref:Roadblock/LAMTOR2 domain-containing protein n=1 Tax=Manduca sexta TaxID=7130 RepID=A0A921ZBI8_MANSE|nr:dynein light chain roadblock-type 1 [Manduca sexta]KAG6453879.1 hypothetical protein O3G_MSEX008373 [Manduca sexta]
MKMKISTNLLKDTRDEWLAKTSATINTVNPIIDRIMEDESVEGVIMTNKEGAPILTNVSLTTATNYGLSFNRYGNMAQNYIKELDPFDAVIVMRINTKKIEIMVAPDPEFNIIVIQHARHKTKLIDKNIKNK